MKTIRACLFWCHLAAGCTAGIVILAMSLTGVLLAFERQINQWADGKVVQHTQTSVAPSQLLASATGKVQGVPTQLVLRRSMEAPAELHFGREKTLLLDPATAQVLGEPSSTTRAFFAVVERIHRSLGLGMQSALGRGATSAANMIFLFLLLSGLYLWMPRTFSRENLRNRLRFRSGLTGRAREWNWHNVIGIWSAFPLLFIVLTGVVMSYPWASNLLFRLSGSTPSSGFRGGPRRGDAQGPQGQVDLQQYQILDQVLVNAVSQNSQWRSVTIELPQTRDKTIHVTVDTSIGGQPDRTIQLTFDRQTANIQTIHRFTDNSLGSRLRAYARFVHTGEELGVAGEALAALASLGGVVLVWSGLSMAVRRLAASLARARKTTERRFPASV